jgi:hypothetical protein
MTQASLLSCLRTNSSDVFSHFHSHTQIGQAEIF